MDQPPAITVGDVMAHIVVSVSMDDSLRKIRESFDLHRFHHVLVVNGRKLVGVISDRDLLRHISPFVGNAFAERSQDLATLNKRAHQIMTREPIAVSAETPVSKAIELVLQHGISCLPIVDSEMLPIGIVTWRDLLRHEPIAA